MALKSVAPSSELRAMCYSKVDFLNPSTPKNLPALSQAQFPP
jgi:hypothetical protein